MRLPCGRPAAPEARSAEGSKHSNSGFRAGYSARGIKTPFAGPWVFPPSDWDEEGKNKSGASGGDDDISAG